MLHFPYWKLVPFYRDMTRSFFGREGVCFFNESFEWSFLPCLPTQSGATLEGIGSNALSAVDLTWIRSWTTKQVVSNWEVSNFSKGREHIPPKNLQRRFFPHWTDPEKNPEYLIALASNLPRDPLVRSIFDGNIYLIPSFIKKSLYLRSDILENIRPDIYQYWKVDRSWFFFRPRGTWWFTGELGRYLSPTLFPIQFQDWIANFTHSIGHTLPPKKEMLETQSVLPKKRLETKKRNLQKRPTARHLHLPHLGFSAENLGFDKTRCTTQEI